MSKALEELKEIIATIPPNINYRIIVNYSFVKENEYLISVKDTKYFINNNDKNNYMLNLTIESKELFYDYSY